MSWNTIIGQENQKQILQNSINKNRIHNSYLFYGIEGVGKAATAIEFAKVLNCHSPIIDGNAISACDNCQSCKQFHSLIHPNLYLIYSLPTPKNGESKNDDFISRFSDEQILEIQNQMQLFAENPYHKIMIPSANSIKIDQIRELKRKISLRSGFVGKQVVIIFNANEMTPEASNSLLKTLEESDPNTVIILTTSRKEIMLSTILSRTQHIYFQPLTYNEIYQYISQQFQLEDSNARIIATLANGSLTTALQYIDKGFTDTRLECIEIFRTVLKKKNYRIDFLKKIEKIVKEEDQKSIINGLLLFQNWLRDAYNLSLNPENHNIVNTDQIEVITNFVHNFKNYNFLTAFSQIENSVILIKKNVNIQIILVNLFLSLRQIVYNSN
ncbi:hypothetical protein LLG34_02455 [bacterium]|nr:hypothetical protein [bacterium]